MDYRRFVSYIYRYRENDKINNCGFVRIEVRQNVVRLIVHMQIPGRSEEMFQIYGFVRNEQNLEGIRIGSGVVKFENLDVRIQTEKEKLELFDRFAGIVIRDSHQGVYATVWDEEPVDWSRFSERTGQEKEGAEATQPQKEGEEAIQPQKEGAEATQPQKEGAEAIQPQKEGAEVSQQEEDVQLQMTQETEHAFDWKKVMQSCPEIRCFEYAMAEDADEHFFRILPGQLHVLPERYRYLAKNSFLLHGYLSYRYLMIGKIGNRILLGVPGTYYPQEENIAEVFGFGQFFPTTEGRPQNGQLGYWGMWLDS